VRRGDPSTFRELVPLTTYATYEPLLKDQPTDILAQPILTWARTSGRGGQPKWVPFTQEAYTQLGQCALASHMLAAARKRGDVNIRPNDVVALNLPPRPFLSGLAIVAMSNLFEFRFIPRLDESEKLSFQERIAWVFRQAMVDGIDLLGAMTIVLVKMGEQFEQGGQKRKFTWQSLHPALLWRYARAKARARAEGRSRVLPRDLWQPKGIMCGGTDTSVFRERIKDYWGVYPHETYGTTEAGLIATQAWDHQNMMFIPSSAFYEFIPVKDWAAERLSGVTPSRTVLMNELEAGQRYEVVLSNFYGGALLRYRLHDLIEIVSLGDEALGIHLPQFRFVGRSGDFIDLSGFAGLIEEKQIIVALQAAQIGYIDWVVRKEMERNQPMLRLYIEIKPSGGADPAPEEIAARVHQELKRLNPDYENIETMLGFVPVQAVVLPPGTFSRYTAHQVQAGADLAHLKPMRIQPSQQVMDVLLAASRSEPART
jgi:phenylacetate-coenzyme A ligase PaaK-like adenylate-forming protein